jgi:hypothetical protein
MSWSTGGDFSNKKLCNVDFTNARIVGASMVNASFEGEIVGLKINGIEVQPLISSELERRHPERKELFTTTPEGMKHAYDIVFGQIDETLERARRLTEGQRNERVDDEWSVVETIRHLVFAVDAWILRVVLGRTDPYDPIGLPFTEMPPTLGVTCDPEARPSFDEAVAVWKGREQIVRGVVDGLTPQELERKIIVAGDGYPAAGVETEVIGPLWTILEEAWWHNRFMNRDMDVLEGAAT